jgi:hypothetical protein
MQTVLAVFVALHGLAHLVGFAGAWQLGEPGRVLHKSNIFGGRFKLSSSQLRLAGLLWLICALAFIVVAVLQHAVSPFFPAVALGVAATSGLLCLAFLPEARIGLAINVMIIAAVLLYIIARAT